MNLKSEKSRYLSTVLCCCLMAGASMGLCFYSAGVFAEPVSQGLGISLGSASLMQTIVLASMAIMTLVLPIAIRKLPYVKILLVSGIVCVGATLGLSFSFNSGFLYFFSALQGLSAACFGFLPVSIIINNWFYEKNGWVLSAALAFAPLTAACFVLMYGVCVQALGWRMTYVIQAVCIAVFLAPALLLPLKSSPAKLGMTPYGNPDAAEHKVKNNSKNSIIFILLVAILGAVLLGLPQHFSSLSISLGQPALLGASMFSYCMLGSIIFKLVGGMLSDQIGPFYSTGILGLFTLVGTIGLMICSFAPNDTALKVLAFFYGASYGLAELSLPLFVRNQFSKGRFSTIYALANAVSMMVIAASIGLIGFIYDHTQTYRWIVLVNLIINVCIVCLVGYVYYRQSDKMIHNFSEKMKVRREEKKARLAEQKAQEEQAAKEKAEKEKAENEKAAAESTAEQNTENDSEEMHSENEEPVHVYSASELDTPMESDLKQDEAAEEKTDPENHPGETAADADPEPEKVLDEQKKALEAATKIVTAEPETPEAKPKKSSGVSITVSDDSRSSSLPAFKKPGLEDESKKETE